MYSVGHKVKVGVQLTQAAQLVDVKILSLPTSHGGLTNHEGSANDVWFRPTRTKSHLHACAFVFNAETGWTTQKNDQTSLLGQNASREREGNGGMGHDGRENVRACVCRSVAIRCYQTQSISGANGGCVSLKLMFAPASISESEKITHIKQCGAAAGIRVVTSATHFTRSSLYAHAATS